jgi:hypothetical protein
VDIIGRASGEEIITIDFKIQPRPISIDAAACGAWLRGSF